MRRFLIRNAAGEQVGEGVEWSYGAIAVCIVAEGQLFEQLYGAGLEVVGPLLEKRSFTFMAEAETMLDTLGLRIDWLDPVHR